MLMATLAVQVRSLRAIALVLFSIAATALPQKSVAFLGSNMDAVHATLDRFFFQYGGARELANSAAGILVFPSVVKAGFGFGGEYGEGALLIQGTPVDYYNTVSASFGFQLGAQVRSVIIMFMTPEALEQFRRTAGWKVGIDGSIAIITELVARSIPTRSPAQLLDSSSIQRA
jgi:lipid-binding SYLF domain-containing protein